MVTCCVRLDGLEREGTEGSRLGGMLKASRAPLLDAVHNPLPTLWPLKLFPRRLYDQLYTKKPTAFVQRHFVPGQRGPRPRPRPHSRPEGSRGLHESS